MASKIVAWGLLLVVLSSLGCRGMTWPRVPFQEPAPIVFSGPPTMNDIVRVVNSNSAPIRQLHGDGATVTVAGFPPLRTNLEIERPRRFRMRAELLGPEMDLGSNDELFWFWVKRNPQPAVYYARHEQFARSNTRQMLPVDPLWLTDALGVVQFDPLAKFEGPFPAGQNRVQIRTKVPTPEGEQTRAYILHDQYGWILEQHVYDVRGQVIASARASKHRHFPNEQVTLPLHVDLQIPSAQLSFSVNVSGYQFNNLHGDTTQLWALPKFEGYPLVDLADPNLRMTPNGLVSMPAANAAPVNTTPTIYPTNNFSPNNGMMPNNTVMPALGNPPATPVPNPSSAPYSAPQPTYRLNQRGMPARR